MLNTTSLLILSLSGLSGLGLIAMASAWGFRSWLDLKRCELASGTMDLRTKDGVPAVGNRIELADLRERVKKLEAIAAGVEL